MRQTKGSSFKLQRGKPASYQDAFANSYIPLVSAYLSLSLGFLLVPAAAECHHNN